MYSTRSLGQSSSTTTRSQRSWAQRSADHSAMGQYQFQSSSPICSKGNWAHGSFSTSQASRRTIRIASSLRQMILSRGSPASHRWHSKSGWHRVCLRGSQDVDRIRRLHTRKSHSCKQSYLRPCSNRFLLKFPVRIFLGHREFPQLMASQLDCWQV